MRASLQILDLEPAIEDSRKLVLDGLSMSEKTLPCRLLYDERGAKLFEQICRQPEYYLTRSEFRILAQCMPQVSLLAGKKSMLIEPGSGNAIKSEILLEHLNEPLAYVPIDISKEQLKNVAKVIAQKFSNLDVLPVCADYMSEMRLPEPSQSPQSKLVFFPGSTIGNFEPSEAIKFLSRLAVMARPAGAVLLGVDIRKDRTSMEKAYNDKSGITAAFNLNLLKRIAREFNVPDFSDRFFHTAIYNEKFGRIEMKLVSRMKQSICLAGQQFHFEKFESICTEHCYKYTLEQIKSIAQKAGLELVQHWTDAPKSFAMLYMMPANRNKLSVPAPYMPGSSLSVRNALR